METDLLVWAARRRKERRHAFLPDVFIAAARSGNFSNELPNSESPVPVIPIESDLRIRDTSTHQAPRNAPLETWTVVGLVWSPLT